MKNLFSPPPQFFNKLWYICLLHFGHIFALSRTFLDATFDSMINNEFFQCYEE
jgi:hypothetical protein